MQALDSLGLDMARLRAIVGHVPDTADGMVPQQAYLSMWQEALSQYRDDALPTALAMSIPFGAFGALDYLIGSAATVGGAIESAQLHFTMVSNDAWLDLHLLEDGTRTMQVRALPDVPVAALEFTLACLFNRMRHVTGGDFAPLRVALLATRSTPDPIRESTYGAALRYGYPCAEIAFSSATWKSPCNTADPYLHTTLKQLAQMQSHKPADSALESALRVRLRGALAQGQADSSRMARLLGVSERTLQRRLTEIDRSYSQIVEDFRREESARLLSDRTLHLVEVASRLGYSEQTSFTRAFRRWHRMTPSHWRAEVS